jgi:4-amino-4-deoxy-L-arabinose transferase-like glycosyltransferase
MFPPPESRVFARDILIVLVVGLLVYGAQAFLYPHPLVGDELRYLQCARYITEGRLTPAENPDYVNGPGYPAVLTLFLNWDGPRYLGVRLLHACLTTGAALMLFLTTAHYAGRRWALAGALFLLLHPNTMRITPQLLTEPLTLMCICTFIWSFCKALRSEKWLRWALLSVVALAWAILTRVMFGHVTVAILIFAGAAFLFWKRQRQPLGRTVAVAAAALLLCVPYLADTHEKTGKLYCWSTNSGELLYWMTSTNPGERGNWFDYKDAMTHRDLAANHREFFQRVTALPALQRDAAFMEAAKEHIKADPKGVCFNWVCNVVRLCFNTPRSFKPEELKTLVITAFNGPLIIMVVLAFVLAWRNPGALPMEVAILWAFAAIYFGGSTLASSLARYFLVITPLLWVAAATVLSRTMSIRLGIR